MNIQKTNTQEKNTPKNNTQEELNEYFNKVWELSPIDEWEYSGLSLLRKIAPHKTVIDVGCGDNLFKDKIPNLLGTDPANDAADIKINIEEFEPDNKYDVALCLGSINFGNEKKITNQISKVISILNDTSRIYWRCNPGHHDHDNQECSQISFFPWNEEWMEYFADMFNYKINFMTYENHKTLNKQRLYSEWIKE